MSKNIVVDGLNQIRLTDRLMMPLAGVSWFTVGPFLHEAYLSKDCKSVVIRCTVNVPTVRNAVWHKDGGDWIGVVPVEKQFGDDISHFLYGEYTQFSQEARDRINDLSGLQYNLLLPSGYIEHNALLVAIDPSPEMRPWREALASQLGEVIYGEGQSLDPDGELLSKPRDRERVFYSREIPGQ